MRQTYRITKDAVREWWGELSRKGHVIIIIFGLGLMMGFAVLAISTFYAIQTKLLYREKIQDNTDRIENLERKNGN